MLFDGMSTICFEWISQSLFFLFLAARKHQRLLSNKLLFRVFCILWFKKSIKCIYFIWSKVETAIHLVHQITKCSHVLIFDEQPIVNQVKQRVILLKKIIQKVFFLIRMFVIFYGGEKVDLVRFVVKTEVDQERGRLFCMLWIINLISGIEHPEIRA